MENAAFRMIAIRVASDNSVGKRKLMHNEFYHFYHGYKITDDKIVIDKSKITTTELYNGYFVDKTKKSPHVSISAIVGENGSGKSSIIELAMRIINNFAAATIGEYKVNPGANHIHYIDGINGELYYNIRDAFYRLKIENRNVVLDEFSLCRDDENIEEYIMNVTPIFDNQEPIHSDPEPFKEWREKGKALKHFYQHFFYTFVSNYSIYAYNTLDFKNECNPLEYEQKIRGGGKNAKYSIDDRCWLNGIFHKNDGYQTPIVLTPFRNEGNININIENKLAKERLISLMIMSDSGFRTINGHLEAQSFTLTKKNVIYNASYLKEKAGFKRLQNRGYEKFETLITKFWGDVLKIDLAEFEKTRSFYKEAIGYLTYKTLKISSNYSQYYYFLKEHKGINYKINEKRLSDLVSDLAKDSSHITKKIRQVLSYIIYGTYDEKSNIKKENIDINSVAINAMRILKDQETHKSSDSNKMSFSWKIDDFVPPPIFETKINLIDTNTNSTVIFETLSSGERQQAYSISSLLYHLANLNSVSYDKNRKRIEYKNINVVLEEIELYFHPELQKNFVKYILDGLKQIDLPNIDGINICIITHSPFILSDIPTNNILLLDKDARPNENLSLLKTFGANIHDLLKSSFFLTNGSIGEYVQWLINKLIISMNILYIIKSKNLADEDIEIEESFMKEFFSEENNDEYDFLHEFTSQGKFDLMRFKEKFTANYLHHFIMLFDEPIIRNALLEEYYKIFSITDNKEKRVSELKKQLRDLGEDI